ncbi:MAG: hypothetical protein ACFE7E_08500 [Candidatus Hodarchaeota archaeon]
MKEEDFEEDAVSKAEEEGKLILYRFKWLCADCEYIDDVITTLKKTVKFFEEKKEQGWRITGDVADDYMYLVAPDCDIEIY